MAPPENSASVWLMSTLEKRTGEIDLWKAENSNPLNIELQ